MLDVLKAELPSAIERELRSIKLAADHLQLFARNSLSSYKMQSGQMELASVFFSPVKLCARRKGTDATRPIREREGDERAIIVGHSANQTEKDQEKGRASGQDLFWAKPPPPGKEMLLDAMRLWGE